MFHRPGLLAVLLGLAACGSEPPLELLGQLDHADEACGETHLVDMTLSGRVLDADWQPVPDVGVWVEERDWNPGKVHGTGLTDQAGHFDLALSDLPLIEGCWSIGPRFFVAAEEDTLVCEVPADTQLVIAWLDSTLDADLSGYPCVLADPDA